MTDLKLPTVLFPGIRFPALVLHGGKTDARLAGAARAVAEFLAA